MNHPITAVPTTTYAPNTKSHKWELNPRPLEPASKWSLGFLSSLIGKGGKNPKNSKEESLETPFKTAIKPPSARDFNKAIRPYLRERRPVPQVLVEDLLHAYNNQVQVVTSYEELGYIPSGDAQPARLAGSAY